MKNFSFLVVILLFLSIGAQAQSTTEKQAGIGNTPNYSGTYNKKADSKLDGIVTPQFPGLLQLGKVDETHYTGTADGRDVNVTLYKSGGKTLFTVTDIGNGYVSVGSGMIDGNVFIGSFSDMNGAKGDFSWTKQ